MKPLKALINKDNLHKFHTNKLKEIKNPKYIDLLIPGNVVEIDALGSIGHHHGIIMSAHDYNSKFSKKSNTTFVIVTLNYDSNYLSSWDCHYFKENFPNGNDFETKIINIYNSNIDVSKIKDANDIIKLYRDFKLIPI